MTEIEEAKRIMGDHFIGPDELSGINELRLMTSETVRDIPYSSEFLKEKAKDYLMILGTSKFEDGRSVTIRSLQGVFGKEPEVKEPCFYNQDWYDKERFIDVPMKDEWFLIRKTVFDDSRAIQPDELKGRYTFPSAIRCCYAFFVTWLTKGEKLWYHDFVWCSDKDHNGDQIYVGKYHDVDGVNKNGFNIHRYLSLNDWFGCVD